MKQSFLVGMACGALIALGGVLLGQQLPRTSPEPATGLAAQVGRSAVQAGRSAVQATRNVPDVANQAPGHPGARGAARALDFLVPAAAAKGDPASPAGPERGGLVATYGVGGVLTRDGELWQYRPDRSRWLTLDESFGLEGKPTKLVPLPVAAADVKLMETFGFLVTRKDECWLYDLDKNAWSNIGAPPFKGQGR
jgi:hypothetical protein